MLPLGVTREVNTLLSRFDHGELRACNRFCAHIGPLTSLDMQGRNRWKRLVVKGWGHDGDKRRQTAHVGNVTHKGIPIVRLGLGQTSTRDLNESTRLLQNSTKIQVARMVCHALGNRLGFDSVVLATSWPCNRMRLAEKPESGRLKKAYVLVLDESRHANQSIVSPEPVLSGQFPSRDRPSGQVRVNGMDGDGEAGIGALVARSNINHEEPRFVIAPECVVDL